jgi:hypothetical protein
VIAKEASATRHNTRRIAPSDASTWKKPRLTGLGVSMAVQLHVATAASRAMARAHRSRRILMVI